MGLDPLTIGLAVGGVSAASSLLNGVSQSQQRKAQAQALNAQAENVRAQGRMQEAQGKMAERAIANERTKLRQQYESVRGANAVSLGAGNVDLSSGSALDVASGNAQTFASDIGENVYQQAIKRWETENQRRANEWQAGQFDAQATYLKRASSNLAPTILGAALSGAGGFASGYTMAGGSLAKLFGNERSVSLGTQTLPGGATIAGTRLKNIGGTNIDYWLPKR